MWSRWGRIGTKGQHLKMKLNDLEKAIEMFEKKIYEKTRSGQYKEDDYEKEEIAGMKRFY